MSDLVAERLLREFEEWRRRHPLLGSGLSLDDWWAQRVELGLVNHGASSYTQNAYRVRDDSTALNTDGGWYAAENTAATVDLEKAFRIRFQVSETAGNANNNSFALQYRIGTGGTWTDCVAETGWPTPTGQTSISAAPVSWSAQYVDGAACSTDLMTTAGTGSFDGTGEAVEGSNSTGTNNFSSSHTQWEWAVTIHRIYDGPNFIADAQDVYFRMVQAGSPNTAFTTYTNIARVDVNEPSGIIGGAFAEAPTTIGPFRDGNGNLYAIVENAEAEALVCMMKSTDGGVSWEEMDGANRPTQNDMESASAFQDTTNGKIYIAHQPDPVYEHVFNTSDAASGADTWASTDTTIDSGSNPLEQAVALVDVSAGASGDSRIVIYGNLIGGLEGITWRVHNGSTWGSANNITTTAQSFYGVAAWFDPTADEVHFVYADDNGTTIFLVKKVLSYSGGWSVTDTQTIVTGLSNSTADRIPFCEVVGYYDGAVQVVGVAWRDHNNLRVDARTWRDNVAQTTTTDVLGEDCTRNFLFSRQPGLSQFVRNNRRYLVWASSGGALKYIYSEDEGTWTGTTTVASASPSGTSVGYPRAAALDGATTAGIYYDAGDAGGGTGQVYYDSFTIPAETGGSISGTAAITEAVSTINGDGDVDISGTAAVTEAVDAVNGDGGVELSGTAAVSEVTDSVNGDGTVQDSPINGTAAITEAVDAVSATGSVTTNGSAAVAEQSDTVTAVGDVDISGTAAVAENVDTLSATGDVDISGTAAITEAVDVVAAAGGVVISGTSAITEAVDTIVATGNVGVTGTAAITEAVDAVSATGDVDISGTAAVTEATDTVAGVGDVPLDGSAAVTEVTDSVNGDGSVGSVVNGTAAITEQSDTVAAAGDLPISGTSAITEITDTVAASGSVEISGTATITEATDTVTATGGVEINGAAAITEASDTVAGVGAGEITGRTGTAGSGVSFLDDFTGTNGNPWDSTKWPTQDTTGGGVIDIQSNQGRFDFPTNPSRAGAFGSVQVSDFELTLTRVCPTGRADWFVNWRDGGSWFGGTVGGSANVGYTIAFFSFTNGYELRRVDPIEIVVLDTVTSATAWDYTSTDEYSVRIRHIGSDLKVKVWRTLDGEPGAWTSEITDGHYKVGGISLGGGYRSLAGSDRFDNVQVVAYGAAEAADTVTATGGVEIDGSAAVTEASDTVAGAGDIPVSGSAAVTEATDIVVASGAEARTGSAAVTEVTDTVTALGDIPISAAAAVAEAVDIIAGAGDIPVSGSVSIAEVTDSVTATGTAEYNGSAAVTEVTDSVTASGTLATVFTGTANTVENYDTVTASGTVTGDLDIRPYWRWHFVRGNGMLFLTPVRNGHAWKGYDVVSETFRFNSRYHAYANDKVAAAWASNKNEPTATLKAAMDAALDAAGFKDIFGGPLV